MSEGDPVPPGALFVPPAVAPAEDEAEQTSRRRRSVVSSSQRIVLTSMVGGAAILGTLSPGAPTGHDVVDAVYRAVFVAVLALAASRARRWSVIIGAAIATAASVGFGLIFAGAALLMAVFLVGRDLRNRVYGTCVGAFIGMACLRLDVDWFLGAPAVLAIIASGLVMWSGYRVSRRRTRRVIRWAVAVVALVMVVGVGMAVYEALAFSSSLEKAVGATTDGVSSLQSGSTEAAAEQFEGAKDRFRDVADSSRAWWLFPARMVPVVGHNIEAVTVLSEAGASLTGAAGRISAEVDYTALRREGGGVDLGLLATFRGPVLDAASRLRTAIDDVEEIRSPWIVGLLSERIDEFEAKVEEFRGQTDLAAAAVEFGPALFGGQGERHYLVLLGNPAEARDLGGHIGNWAELRMLDGRPELVQVGRPLQLAQPQLEGAVLEADDLPPSFVGMRPATNPQNWGASMDFPVDAKVAARLFETKTGHRIDGVLYADPQAMAAMLAITGPLPIPGLERTIESSNAVEFLTVDQFSAYPDANAANDALTELVRDLFEKLTQSTLPAPAELGSSFGPLVKSGRLRMVSLSAPDHNLLGLVGLDNGFGPTAGEDLLAVITRNANPSKIDAYLHRETAYDVTWDPDTGAVTSEVTVTLRNDAPADGLSRDAIGNSAGLPWGTNISDLAVVTPFELDRVTVDGIDSRVTPLRDIDVWRHTVRVEIPPGGRVTVVFELNGEVDSGQTYRLRFGGQPLVNDSAVTAKVTAPGRRILGGAGISTSGAGATATLSDTGQTLLTLRAD